MTQRLLLSTCQRLLSTALVLVALPAHSVELAQRVVRVGFVGAESASTSIRGFNAFWERLHELGWVEGKNLIAEVRWAEGRYERLPPLMAEVLGRKIDVLVTYSTPGAVAAKKATTTVPIVVAAMADPVGTGLVASLARPGGNLTGLSLQWEDLGGKWLELLHETIPRLSTVAVIANPDSPAVRDVTRKLPGDCVAPRTNASFRRPARGGSVRPRLQASAAICAGCAAPRRPANRRPPAGDHCTGRSASTSHTLRAARVHRRRWFDDLRGGQPHLVAPRGRLRRQDPERGATQ